jgi:hypothetical protein
LYEEVAFLAYHFHWSHEQLLMLEHAERRQWVNEITKIAGNRNQFSTIGGFEFWSHADAPR